ncbi:transporter substrate-binding domain-containing protein, partial [bacterium]|nr:transporter substrate-binding domain-containing protein [bacterium]
NKEVDLIVIDKLVAQHIIKRDMPGSAAQLEVVDHPLVIHPLFVIFPKKSPGSKKLRDDLNKGLEIIEKDGTVKKIMSRSGLL